MLMPLRCKMEASQIIRVARNFDIHHIYEIEKSVFGSAAWSRENLANCLSNKAANSFIVEDGKNILGYNMVTFVGREFEIIKLAVTPTFQNKGIGNSLLVHFLDQIPKNSSVFLDVSRSNTSGIKLYKKNGFREIYIRYSYYQDGSDALVLCYKN